MVSCSVAIAGRFMAHVFPVVWGDRAWFLPAAFPMTSRGVLSTSPRRNTSADSERTETKHVFLSSCVQSLGQTRTRRTRTRRTRWTMKSLSFGKMEFSIPPGTTPTDRHRWQSHGSCLGYQHLVRTAAWDPVDPSYERSVQGIAT